MDIVVIGLGYVGIANVVALAKKGHHVLGYDINKAKIEALNRGESPLSEPDVASSIKKYRSKITFTADKEEAYQFSANYLIAVDTPSKENGEADLTNFNQVIEDVKEAKKEGVTLIIRSTVPPGTANKLQDEFKDYRIISNPEFLAGGTAIRDELFPMRIVVGAKDPDDFLYIRNIYKKDIAAGVPYFETTNVTAELSKYASNAFLATKISYINSMARLADALGADIDIVSTIMGADSRIGSSMLKAGIGYGGSCFKKDGEALLYVAKEAQISLPIVDESLKTNQTQPEYLVTKMKKELGSLKGLKITVLGLSYKGNCSDLRNSKAFDIVDALLKEEAVITAYDPYEDARENFKILRNVNVADNIREAVRDADCLVIANDNKAFRNMNEQALLKLMKGRHIFDGRNLYPKNYFKYFTYVSIGRPTTKK